VERDISPAPKIRHENLDAYARIQAAGLRDTLRKMISASITQIVAVDRGHHHVSQSHFLNGCGQLERLVRHQGIGAAVRDIAERATTCADIAHYHERRRAGAEAFAEIGT